ncbi:pentapeptide repeat-containing protein [Streptomyces sp. NPDC050732]|uniref:pentapeptide repeat-containing protein n=1 Tax=Streptomyces sp. NPDC050732 TaxID=3154632 RepID=UPI003422B27A
MGRALVPMARPGWDQIPAEDRATAEAAFRLAVIQASLALGASVALVYTVRNYRLTRRGQVTDRFTKALERLGSDVVYIRTGGVLALEQIVQDSRDQATHAAQILNAFVRDRTPWRARAKDSKTSRAAAARRAARRHAPLPTSATALPTRPSSDVQAALTALTRPSSRRHVDASQPINLDGLHLQRAQLTGAHLSGAVLTEARLCLADLIRANLIRARLVRADLSGANLTGARLCGADLSGADLVRAHLNGANLTGARLCGADLTEANLNGANLSGANFTGARLSKAHLTKANLTKADLNGADLTEANLRGVRRLQPEQLLRAYLDGPIRNLPAELAADPAIAARLATTSEE